VATSDRDNMYMQEQVARHGTKPSDGKLLVVMPISGLILRFAGTFFVMNYKKGDAMYQCPAVLFKDGTPQQIDPRCIVCDNGNLARLWAPRLHTEEMDPVAVDWLEANPGYAKTRPAAEVQPREVKPDRDEPVDLDRRRLTFEG